MSQMNEEKSVHYDAKTLGFVIKKRRRDMGYTQEYLALKIGCSSTHLSRIESGAPTSLERFYRICRELDLSMDEAMGIPAKKSHVLENIEKLFGRHSISEQVLAVHILEEVFRAMDVLQVMRHGYSLTQALHKLGFHLDLMRTEHFPSVGYAFHRESEQEISLIADTISEKYKKQDS